MRKIIRMSLVFILAVSALIMCSCNGIGKEITEAPVTNQASDSVSTPANNRETGIYTQEELLYTQSYDNESFITDYDYTNIFYKLRIHIKINNPALTDEELDILAAELTKNYETARNNAIAVKTVDSDNDRKTTHCFSLGSIEDGDVSYNSGIGGLQTEALTLVHEGWTIEPHISGTAQYSKYTTAWQIQNKYVSGYETAKRIIDDLSVSVDTGYRASGKLTADVAMGYGLSADESDTCTSSVKIDNIIDVPAWTIAALRPTIIYNTDSYSGTYESIYYDAESGQYIFGADDYTSTNTYCTFTGGVSWSETNETQTPVDIAPMPPTGWYL